METCRFVIEGSLLALVLWVLLHHLLTRRFDRWSAAALVPVCVAINLWMRGRLDMPWAAGVAAIGICVLGAECMGWLPRSAPGLHGAPSRGDDRVVR